MLFDGIAAADELGISLSLGLLGGLPFQMREEGVECGDLLRQLFILARLAGLTLQALKLALHLCGHFRQALEICLGGTQFQFGFMPARIETGNTGGFFKDPATVLRFGADQLGNLALPHERWRVRTSRGIREDELDVLAANGAAIQLVGRAGAALQAAHDFQRVRRVELWRGGARRIVEDEGHFREFAGRARLRAGEDQVVHLPAAHRLGGACAHRPAERFEQVRLATAIRPDNACQAGKDRYFLWIDEGFEACDAQFCQMQGRLPSLK